MGTANMVKKMREMLVWHIENFEHIPVGDGTEIDVTEFDWKDENGLCYDQEGVTVRHWPRSHVKDGASAYRLDWEESDLSFVWTGDGRPDEKTVEHSQGVDVFVSEGQIDLPAIIAMKWGTPEFMTKFTIDTYHTPFYAAGLMFKEIEPRLAMVTHTNFDDELMDESVAEVRAHWPGLFVFGAPDVMVVNITKDSIWARKAALPDGNQSGSLDPRAMFPPGQLPDTLRLPDPVRPREKQQEQFLRDMEIDPSTYYPPDVDRELATEWPKDGVELDVKQLLRAKGVDVDEASD